MRPLARSESAHITMLEAPYSNSSELYIFSRVLTKANHYTVANLDGNEGQPQQLSEITFLNGRGKPITAMSMKKAACGMY
jgi:hypothetical protein